MKVYKLFEQFKRDPDAFKGTWKQLLGYQPNGKMDKEKRHVDIYDISLQELAREFLGRDYMNEMTRLFEGPGGGQVLGSTFQNISAWSDAVAGLVGVMILDAYESPMFIGSQLVTEKQTNVQGGKIVGISNDGEVAGQQDLQPGEPYPNVGLRETFVSVPDMVRRGNAIELNRDVFLYDLTGLVQERAQTAGFNVARQKELAIADMVLGISETYSRDDANKANTNPTYQAAVAVLPQYNYVNEQDNELVDWNSIDQARVLLGTNLDPATGYEINISPENMILLVAPGRHARTSTVVNALQVRTGPTAVDTASIRLSESPIMRFPILSSQIWYNRLVLAAAEGGGGLTADEATERWYMLNGPRAFEYRTAWPFTTQQTTIGTEQTKRDIVVSLVTSEVGVPVVKEPRHVYRANDET